MAKSASLRTVSLANGASTQVAPASLKRTLLRLFVATMTNGAGVISFVSPGTPTAAGQGVPLASTSGQPLEITREQHGDLVMAPWFAWAVGAAGIMAVIESEEFD